MNPVSRACVQVLVGFCTVWPVCASAQSSFESEPNNTPAQANPIAGATTVLGTMNEGDQDGFMWTVSDEDAQKRWIFELQGIPGRLTIADFIRVEFSENGVDVASTAKLTTMGTRDGYTPAITRELIFEPGEYLIGIAYSGGGSPQPATGGAPFRLPAAGLSFGGSGTPETSENVPPPAEPEPGAYRLIIREAQNVNLQPLPQGDSKADAKPVRGGTNFDTFETRESAWYTFEVSPEDTNQRWDIRVQVPVGRQVDVTLFDADGQQLDKKRSSERGHLEFPDIVPREQPYALQIEPLEHGHVVAISSEKIGQRVEGEEAEPNGAWDLANRVDFSQPLRGRTGDVNEYDYFKFVIDEAGADHLQVLRLDSVPPEQHVRLCLHDADQTQLQCRDQTTPIELPDLLLRPGEYGLAVLRARSEFEYTITLSEQGPVEQGVEVEPNDELVNATTVPSNLRIKGRGRGEENDYFQFLVAEEPQLWRFQVIGEGIIEFNLYDGSGNSISTMRPKAGQKRLRLENVFLLPGRHFARIRAGDGSEYTLLARAIGPPDPNGEREPNDDTSRMQRLAIGQTRTGLLNDENDTDYYRFFLANWDHVRLTVTPPPDGIVAPHLYWYDSTLAQGVPAEPGQVMSFAGVLPPGDYHVQLAPTQPSDAEYLLSLERLPRWSCLKDCEPNGLNTYYGQSPLPATLVVEGVSGQWRDSDTYELPVLAQDSGLTIHSAEPLNRLFLGKDRHDNQALRYDAETGTYSATVPAGEQMQLIVDSAQKPYRLELQFDNGPQALADPNLSALLSLELETDTVSAFRQHGQHVSGQLTISQTGGTGLPLTLEATTSDYRWQVSLQQQAIELPPGGRTSVPLDLRVPHDAWADRPVRVSVRAMDSYGAQAEAWVDVTVDREKPAVNPVMHWAIPETLRGGFNAAWQPLGAELAGDVPGGADNRFLRDGLVIDGLRTECCSETYGWKDSRPAITLDLPGDNPAPVAGLAVDNFGTPWPYRNLRKGALLVSMDGQSFEEVLSIDILPVETEQYFALDEPVMARFAQMRMDETWERDSGAGGVTMGEWKAILAPGYDISGGSGFNLADQELGGHLVWDSPPEYYSPVTILDEGVQSNLVRSGNREELEYVIGFHENRAAQIQRVEWTNHENVNPEFALEKVSVSVSTESPIGPWTEVGELDPGVSAETQTLTLDSPVWARFVKFTGARQGESNIIAAPNVIRIWERPSSEDYRSALAEWGSLSRASWFEEQAGIPPEPELRASSNTSRGSAAPLSPGATASGQVELAKVSHWYRLSLTGEANTLKVMMSGAPTVRTLVAIETGDGTAVPVKKLPSESTPNRHVFEAFADPGSELYFHVFEPPRNVIFTWDTSASVNAHLPTIYNALSAFVSAVVPGQESANFVPFSESPLLDTWLGEPYMLQTILNDYPRKQSSSAGEFALTVSTQTLAPVAGTKSVVIITDGAVNHHGPLWKELRDIQPRVFSIGVAGEEAHNIDLFQDWSSVNGGYFTHLRYQGEMEVAFDRASTLMRRPADYTLAVQTEYREAPGPGRLTVNAAAQDSGAKTAGGAVELILDASGSMLQRMEGKRRIVIAKEVLTEAVRERIPAGTPVVLRVFGHTEPGTCDTERLVPLGPLDPEVAAAAIAGVEAKNLAKTPIADSLAAVPGDLDGATTAAVILVTDGEETCGGDPAAVIQSLRDRGIDVSVNIVGFAIDDDALETQFREWSELGGGRYFSAQDESGLSEAIEEALQVPFAVYDSSGELVAEGLVGGEPVELDRGVYRVVVKSSPQKAFEGVELAGEDEVTLELD